MHNGHNPGSIGQLRDEPRLLQAACRAMWVGAFTMVGGGFDQPIVVMILAGAKLELYEPVRGGKR